MPRNTLTPVILTSLLAGPVAAQEGWDLIGAVEVEEAYVVDADEGGERYVASKTYPDALMEAAEGFTITGHVVVLVPEPELTTFLLIEDPDDCPFCGTGEGGAALEVVAARPIGGVQDADRITVRGTLTPIRDPDTYQAIRLVDAERLNDG